MTATSPARCAWGRSQQIFQSHYLVQRFLETNQTTRAPKRIGTKQAWMAGTSPIGANLSHNRQSLGCLAPLQAGHPVIPAWQAEAKPRQIQSSVVTGSSAYADDDDREHNVRLKLPPMGTS